MKGGQIDPLPEKHSIKKPSLIRDKEWVVMINQLSNFNFVNIGKYFTCFSYFDILSNMINSYNICHIALGTVR